MSLITLASLVILLQEPKSEAVMVDRVAIKVNDKMMTERELIAQYHAKKDFLMSKYQGDELDRKLLDAWDDVLEESKEKLLLFEKASELGVAVTEEEVKGRLESIRQSNGLSEEEFELAVKEQTGMTYQEYVDFQIVDSSVQNVVQSQVVSQIYVDDSEIAKFYNEHKAEFMIPEKYRIAEIVFLKNQESGQPPAVRAELCAEDLKKGKDFAEAAQAYSDSISKENGGDLGEVEFGDLNKTIEDQVRGMKVGDVSPVLETSHAFFIIKLLDHQNASPKPIDEVKAEIRNKIRAPKLEEEILEYIDSLKGDYLVDVLVKNAPDDK